MTRRGAALLLALLPLSAYASVFDHPADATALETLLQPAVTTLREARTLRGDFTQRRLLPDLPRPLLADGGFVFVRDRGMVWNTRQPFPSELTLTRDALIQRDGPDADAMRLGAGEHPGVRLVAQLFFAIFALDFDALAELFELHGMNDGGHWQLGLHPRDPALAASLREIVVSGRAHVEQVVMQGAAGDRTEIRLDKVTAQPAEPDADELRRLFP
jgi:hypothetical protein